jgi:predicted SprT family Zn-dependent metalloprotease
MGEISDGFLDRMFDASHVRVRAPRKNKNHRYSCACGHKTTKRQLKLREGRCHQCGVVLPQFKTGCT